MGTASELYKFLKSKDDEQNPLPDFSSLMYGQEIRYWFWRLDYYIWKNRKEIFAEKPAAQEVAENYIFRRNRSIEHIAPQTPETDSKVKWDDTPEDTISRNSFGNLAMISQGLNSSLSNESYEIKAAYVQSYCNQAKSGTIESLKLLVVHQEYKHWDKETIREHGGKMYEWLKDSFVQE